MEKKRIKIAILILSNTWGGAEESVYKIAKYLDKNKLSVHLLVNDFLYQKYKSLNRVKLENLGELESNKKIKKIYTILQIRNKIARYLKSQQIRILHAQLENSLLVLALMPNLKPHLIFTLRGQETNIYHRPKTLEHHLIRYTLKQILNNSKSSVTSVSDWLVKDFDEKTKKKILTTVNGVDTKLFKPIKIKRTNNSVLYVGRLIEKKGIDKLVDLAKTLPNIKFLFVGKGELSKSLKLKNTIYLGFKSREELIKIYNQATLCCFPSEYAEGMPNVGLEAISCGSPIVASRNGYSDFIENNKDGIIVNPSDRKKLKKTVLALIKNSKLRKRLSLNARKKALIFDIRKTVKRYQDLYYKVLVNN